MLTVSVDLLEYIGHYFVCPSYKFFFHFYLIWVSSEKCSIDKNFFHGKLSLASEKAKKYVNCFQKYCESSKYF